MNAHFLKETIVQLFSGVFLLRNTVRLTKKHMGQFFGAQTRIFEPLRLMPECQCRSVVNETFTAPYTTSDLTRPPRTAFLPSVNLRPYFDIFMVRCPNPFMR